MPELMSIAVPETAEIREESALIVRRAEALTVTTKEAHEEALQLFRESKVRENLVREKLDPLIADANRAHKGLTALRAELIAPFEKARQIAGRKASAFEEDQKRIAREEQARLEEIARKEEEDRRVAEAAALETAGETEAAEELISAPAPPPPVIHVQPEVAKVQGVSQRTAYSAEVTDKMALIGYVAAHPEWMHLLETNLPALSRLARDQREAFSVPGCRLVTETVRSVRSVA